MLKEKFIVYIIIAIIGIYRFLLGSIGNVNWDSAIFLDGIWRVFQGHVPHSDFSTPIGPVIFFIGNLCVPFTGMSINSFDQGSVCFYLLITIFSFHLSRKFFSSFSSILFTLLVGSYLITPRIIGYPFYTFGYTSYYNFVGYVLLFILILNLIYGKKNEKGKYYYGFIIGMLSIILFFTKITFGFSAFFLVIISLLENRFNKKWTIGILTGFCFMAMIFIYYFSYDLNPVIRDFNIVLLSSSSESNIIIHLLSLFYNQIINLNFMSFTFMLFPILGVLVLIGLTFRLSEFLKNDLTFSIYLVFIFFIGIGLMITVNQPPEFIISPFICILMFDWLYKKKNKIDRLTFLIGKNISLLIIFIFILNNILSLPVGTYKGIFIDKSKYLDKKDNYGHLNSSYLSKKNLISYSFLDGIELLNPIISKKDRISVLGQNIFSFALEQQSPKHDLLYWHNGASFSNKTLLELDYMKGENIFSETTILMVPRKISHLPYSAIKYYRQYIADNFLLHSTSDYWEIYKTIN